MRQILVTGGAGFIGAHLADELLEHGYRVRVLDSLAAQVHGPDCKRPSYLHPDVELVRGDIRDPESVRKALLGVDAVYHFVALVGVGQSMYQIATYTSVNNVGTAVLLEALAERPVERLVVASSMSIYGEGLYCSPQGQRYQDVSRTPEQLKAGVWDPIGADGSPLVPVPTPEDKAPSLASVYALSKYDQEQMCLIVGRAYHIPTVALRFFNAYGPYQALSNPYTGVLAIFASRLMNGNAPLLFEDGRQIRDFVSVYDVADACRLALETPAAAGQVFNVGSGQPITVHEVAARLANVLGKPQLTPEITGQYRVGDIRHCFPDISRAREVMGFSPKMSLEDGMVDLAAWLDGQIAHDRAEEMKAELAARGLVV